MYWNYQLETTPPDWLGEEEREKRRGRRGGGEEEGEKGRGRRGGGEEGEKMEKEIQYLDNIVITRFFAFLLVLCRTIADFPL